MVSGLSDLETDGATTRWIEGKGDGQIGVSNAERRCSEGVEFGGNPTRGFAGEPAIVHVEIESAAGLGWIGVMAGKSFKLGR